MMRILLTCWHHVWTTRGGTKKAAQRICAAIMLGTLCVSAAHAANVDTILGNVDGVSGDPGGATVLRGWACWKTWSGASPQVDVWVGGEAGKGGVKIGTYDSSQPNEPAVDQVCDTKNTPHRFLITLTISVRQQYAGKAIYVYGVPYPLNNNYTLLAGSGQLRVPDAPAVTDSVYYIHTDRLGSNVIMTDANAHVVAKTNYKAYGAAVDDQQKNEAPGYGGHYEDPLTGLTYMQQRYYDADLGRFISADPVEATSGNVFNFNRYAYANNSPMNFIDPTGMAAQACGAVLNQDGSWDVGGCSGGGGGSAGSGGALSPIIFQSPGQGGGGGGQFGGGGGGIPMEKPVNVTANVVAVPVPKPIELPQIRAIAPNPWLVLFGGLVWPGNGLSNAGTCPPNCYGALPSPYYPRRYTNKSTESKPKGVPPGTIPIDDAKGRFGWDKDDVHTIKDGIGARPRDWTGVSPDGRIWSGDGSGNAIDHGNWEDYL